MVQIGSVHGTVLVMNSMVGGQVMSSPADTSCQQPAPSLIVVRDVCAYHRRPLAAERRSVTVVL